MVKLGFIGEGATEKIILESESFRQYLISNNISFVKSVIDAKGNGNLLPTNIEGFINRLKDEGATAIVILTDLDEDRCISLTKERIDPGGKYIVIVSIKEIESWFLSDQSAMKLFLADPTFSIEHPEDIENPFETIRKLRIEKTDRGIGSKVLLAKQMINNYNFSIQQSVEHPNCSSAKYFIKKINELKSSHG